MAQPFIEKVIPFSRKELAAHLGRRFPDRRQKAEFELFSQLIGAEYHRKFYHLLESFKTTYLPINPDLNVKLIGEYPDEKLLELEERSVEYIEEVLVAGNYERISAQALSDAFGHSSPWGLDLKVDTDNYELMSLFYRGEFPDHYEKKLLFYTKKYYFSVYNRVVLVFKLKETIADSDNKTVGFQKGKLYLKLFKNVPTVDIEMLFPDTKVVIRPVDKIKVVAPLVAGAATTIYKIASYVMREANPVHLWSQIGFWVLVGSLFGIALRGFLKYKTTVDKYLKMLSTSLYFQNLDNNAGVFKYLLDDAEEEECKELILAYHFLLSEKSGVASLDALDKKIEAYFRTELQTELDFEVGDAFRKLVDLGLLSSVDELIPIPLEAAIEKLRENNTLL